MNDKTADLNAEIELRLAVSSEALKTLADYLFPKNGTSRGLRTQKLHAIYYDTEDQRLHRRGLAFRVRKNANRYVQTLKTESSTVAISDRGEWEVDVEGFEPDLRAFKDGELTQKIGLIFPEELKPLFETKIERRVGMFAFDAPDKSKADIEVSFDQGVVLAGDQKADISEIELELKAGSRQALFALASLIREKAPVRLQAIDKAARGYRLASGGTAPWSKAAKVALTPEMTVEHAFSTVMSAGLGHWLENERAAYEGEDSEGVHQMRVALRRLRSALTLFRSVLADEVRISWNERLKRILNELGPARDLDVFEEEMLAPVIEARPDDETIKVLQLVTQANRTKAQAKVREEIDSQAYADTVLELVCWLARGGWRDKADVDVLVAQRMPIAELAAGTLDKGHKRVRKRGRRFEAIEAEERHQVRIALKKLRYGTEFFAALFEGKETKGYTAAASKMQDSLGHLNDVAVTERLVEELVASAKAGTERVKAAMGGGTVIGWYAHLVASTEKETVADWHAFAKRSPFWRNTKDDEPTARKASS